MLWLLRPHILTTDIWNIVHVWWLELWYRTASCILSGIIGTAGLNVTHTLFSTGKNYLLLFLKSTTTEQTKAKSRGLLHRYSENCFIYNGPLKLPEVIWDSYSDISQNAHSEVARSTADSCYSRISWLEKTLSMLCENVNESSLN